MDKADIGLIGLAVMGQNLVLNMNDHGYKVAVYNRTYQRTADFLAGPAAGRETIVGSESLEEFVGKLSTPRKVMMMVKAGEVVDQWIEKLVPLLEAGDVIIDGGNSHFPDTIRRHEMLKEKGLLYIGTGVSGGEEGARMGPSIMPGGAPEAWPLVKPILQDISAKNRRRGGLLRLGGRRRCRSLCKDGAQRNRVWRYADDHRGLSADEGRPGHELR